MAIRNRREGNLSTGNTGTSDRRRLVLIAGILLSDSQVYRFDRRISSNVSLTRQPTPHIPLCLL
jgi:hypothetical protein